MPVIYGVRLQGNLGGQICQNIIHLRNQSGFDIPRNQILDRLFSQFIGQLKFLQCTHFIWTEMKIWKWYDNADIPLVVAISQAGAGVETANFQNPMCVVFQKKTVISGKTGRGRFYMPGVGGGAFFDGKWTSGATSAFESVRGAINGHFTGATPIQQLNLVLVPKHAEGEEYKDVTDFKPRDYPGTQVRRNFLRGR